MKDRVAIRAAAVVAALLLVGRVLPAQEPSPEEVVAYMLWHNASQAGETAKAVEAARAFLKQFPAGKNAEYLGKWLAGVRNTEFNKAIQAKDTAGMLRLGRERLAEDPKDLNYLISLSANLRRNVLLGTEKNPEAEAAAGELAGQAIALIEAGATPAGADFRKEATLALLHQCVAISSQKGGKADAALEHYKASLALQPSQAALAGYNSLQCGRLHKDKYDAAVAAYQQLPEAARTAEEKPAEVSAAIDAINAQADGAINCWARFMGVTAGGASYQDARGAIEQALKALYESRNPGQPDGLQQLIDKYAAQR